MENMVKNNIKQCEVFTTEKKCKQSANSLFNFMKKIDYLKEILKNKAFIPRYYEEIIDYLNNEDINKIAFPMTCFCDINVNKISYHCYNYGNIGIGMSKSWGIINGVQPIQYMNLNSVLCKELSVLFKKAYDEEYNEEFESIISGYKDYLLQHMLFSKPLEGSMYRNDDYELTNFHDEKEWRYVPNMELEGDLPLIVPPKYSQWNTYDIYSQSLRQFKKLWLKFEYEDIRYIFIENELDRKEIINFIINDLQVENLEEKCLLISKILILNHIEEDI